MNTKFILILFLSLLTLLKPNRMRVGKIPIYSDASAVATPEDASFFLIYKLSTDGIVYGKSSDGSSFIIGSTGVNILHAELSLSSAQILALNTSPQTIIPAPGVGKEIEIISAMCKYVAATNYTVGVTPVLKNPSGTVAIKTFPAILSKTVNCTFQSIQSSLSLGAGSDTSLIENEPVVVSVTGSNPVGGTATIKVYVTYRIVTI